MKTTNASKAASMSAPLPSYTTKRMLMGFSLAMSLVLSQHVLAGAGPAPVNLRSAGNFAILAGAAITTTGGGIIDGDVGASPISGSAIGIPAAQVNGTIYAVDAAGPTGSVIDPALLSTAMGDLTTAFNVSVRSGTP